MKNKISKLIIIIGTVGIWCLIKYLQTIYIFGPFIKTLITIVAVSIVVYLSVKFEEK